jgi:hypothetical protein
VHGERSGQPNGAAVAGTVAGQEQQRKSFRRVRFLTGERLLMKRVILVLPVLLASFALAPAAHACGGKPCPTTTTYTKPKDKPKEYEKPKDKPKDTEKPKETEKPKAPEKPKETTVVKDTPKVTTTQAPVQVVASAPAPAPAPPAAPSSGGSSSAPSQAEFCHYESSTGLWEIRRTSNIDRDLSEGGERPIGSGMCDQHVVVVETAPAVAVVPAPPVAEVAPLEVVADVAPTVAEAPPVVEVPPAPEVIEDILPPSVPAWEPQTDLELAPCIVPVQIPLEGSPCE